MNTRDLQPLIRYLLNILWHSNATWMPTGYGSQTKIWTHLLAELGYGVVVSAYRGLEGSPLHDSAGIAHLPRVREANANDVIFGHSLYASTFYPNHGKTDLVWSLIDIFAMNAAQWRPLPWAAWTPVDCEPILMNERSQFQACRWPIAMSRHGEAQMKEIGLKPKYVPHGIDTEVFSPMDRSQARRNMYEKHLTSQPIPDDKFLVVIVGNNGEGGRKNFAGMFEAFQIFLRNHPDALLYVHSDPTGVHGQPIDDMAYMLQIRDHVIFPGPSVEFTSDEGPVIRNASAYMMLTGLPTDDHLRDVYNAADVKLMLSYGEGFGLTDVEAQACGCPMIGSNFSASIEVNFTGWKVNGVRFQPERTPRSYQLLANPEEAAAALGEAYVIWAAGNMPSMRERTRRAALAYDVKRVAAEYFIPVLNEIGEELERLPHDVWFQQQIVALEEEMKKHSFKSVAVESEVATQGKQEAQVLKPVWSKDQVEAMLKSEREQAKKNGKRNAN